MISGARDQARAPPKTSHHHHFATLAAQLSTLHLLLLLPRALSARSPIFCSRSLLCPLPRISCAARYPFTLKMVVQKIGKRRGPAEQVARQPRSQISIRRVVIATRSQYDEVISQAGCLKVHNECE